ncbi:MAG: hypothetical protein ACI9O8_000522, partial [Patiriisocius sp.]
MNKIVFAFIVAFLIVGCAQKEITPASANKTPLTSYVNTFI